MLQVRLSIPLHWQQSLSDNWHEVFPRTYGIKIQLNSDEPRDISSLGAIAMYDLLIEGKGTKALHLIGG